LLLVGGVDRSPEGMKIRGDGNFIDELNQSWE
jgi:hypothetical protein